MKLVDLGEDALIARLLRGIPIGSNVIAGPGDDCAIIGRRRDSRWTLLKVDCVIEGVHFTSDTDPRRIGWKALCRTISDIAAMGGEPRHALITVAAPGALDVEWLTSLYSGIRRAARRFGVGIVGGETSRSPGPIFINVTLTGEVDRERCVRRDGGRPGDYVYVTGKLGGSITGKHLDFTPRVTEAQWLVRRSAIHAMMDLSDGLGTDLPRLAEASECGFAIEERCIPRTRGRSLKQALCDGEDFELLFTLSPEDSTRLEAAWKKKFPRLLLTRIGHLVRKQKRNQPLSRRGYDHFAPTR